MRTGFFCKLDGISLADVMLCVGEPRSLKGGQSGESVVGGSCTLEFTSLTRA